MEIAECMGRPLAPTSQRCSADSSVYRQCVQEGCGNEYSPNQSVANRALRMIQIHGFVRLTPYSQLSVSVRLSESRPIMTCNSFPSLYTPFVGSLAQLRTVRLSHLSPRTVNDTCPPQFSRSLAFYPPSMYYWYTLDTADLKNPSYLTISEIEWPMRRPSTICPRLKVSTSVSLPIQVIPTTNSVEVESLTFWGKGTRNVPPSHIEMYLCLNVESFLIMVQKESLS
ncbi:hypothetical protein TNCV_4904071 [Trichonephila clavipes]|nr:hypothetical protein TNCV_4904071 [Trichonephila clavipes]